VTTAGRWSLFRRDAVEPPPPEFVARQLLRRTGVVFRKTIAREKQTVPWRDLARVYRTLEARGEIRGGRFVAGFEGEQYALPEAVSMLRAVRKRGDLSALTVSAADPLNFRGILTPDERVSPTARQKVAVG
jgi:ATP-dependent Lhr-like helicase